MILCIDRQRSRFVVPHLQLHSLERSADQRGRRSANGAGDRNPRVEPRRACRDSATAAGSETNESAGKTRRASRGGMRRLLRTVEGAGHSELFSGPGVASEVQSVEDGQSDERRRTSREQSANALVPQYGSEHGGCPNAPPSSLLGLEAGLHGR